MTAQLLSGKALATTLRTELATRVSRWREAGNPQPRLVVVLVGEHPASEVYVRNKQRACKKVGIESGLLRLPSECPQHELLEVVERLNRDPAVHGILVQLPLPPQINAQAVLDAIDPLKDVDAFHPENVGLLSQGRPRFLPCTPHGVMQLLHRNEIVVAGKEVVIVGRSEIVGKPLALMLVQRTSHLGPDAANATVTLCHSRTPNLAEVTRRAEILVVAIGKANFITANMVRAGAIVVDVGINRSDDGLCGDVAFDEVREVAAAITPVPGGVGPLTIAMLLENTLKAAAMAAGVASS